MNTDKWMGAGFMALVITLGFLIHGERNMSYTKRDAIEPIVKSIDILQHLAFGGLINFDESLALRLELRDLIKRIDADKN